MRNMKWVDIVFNLGSSGPDGRGLGSQRLGLREPQTVTLGTGSHNLKFLQASSALGEPLG